MNDYIGKLVKQFESGTKGSLALSSCGNDWGLSCGSYQLTLRWGNCISFLKKYFPTATKALYFNAGKPDSAQKEWPGAGYCSSPNEVKCVWTACYNEAGKDKFFEYEHEYIKSQYYDPLLAKSPVKPYNRALQECFWSWSVHKGVSGALTGITKLKDLCSDKLFDAIYDYRYDGFKYDRYSKSKTSERETLRPYLKQAVFEEGGSMGKYAELMTVDEFIAKLKVICGLKTAYVFGSAGEPITVELIDRKAKENKDWYTDKRKTDLKALDGKGYFGFDCSNLIKAILWDWNGKKLGNGKYINYAENTVPDTNADGMIGMCTDVSTDMSNIEIGEAMWFKGHIGIYVGVVNGVKSVIDCVPSLNKVSTNAMSYQGTWCKHGKLPWIKYAGSSPVKVTADFSKYPVIKRGSAGEYVKIAQEILNILKYGLKVDGAFGENTEKAVIAFQKSKKLKEDGVIGVKTWGALMK